MLSDRTRLHIALQKSGRLSDYSRELLRDAGFRIQSGKNSLTARVENFPAELMFVRDDDIPTFVSDGVCEFGIVGQNVLEEFSAERTDLGYEVLAELGFGLDLTECAATGARDDLAFVSPKTGRAVCRAAGLPWADKMLSLPPFLAAGAVEAADGESLAAAFRLTGFFLHRHVYEPRGIEIAAARDGFIQAALKALNAASPEAPRERPTIAAKR